MDIKFNNAYSSDHYTGTFIPKVDKNPFYVLLQADREQNLDVMTAFHEYQHLVDYIEFTKAISVKSAFELKDNPLYATFNIYSEFSATKTGVVQYVNCVQIEGLTKEETCSELLEWSKESYLNQDGIQNRYQYLYHVMQYLGYIFAAAESIPDFDATPYLCVIDLLQELQSLLKHMGSFETTYEWYECFDTLAREFVG